MIQLIEQPKSISLSGNPVLLNIKGLDMYSETGNISRLYLLMYQGQTISEDDTFTLAWGSESIVITFKDAPDDSGLQYITTLLIDEGWANGFRAFLSRNYLINRDFTLLYYPIGTGYAEVRFTSKQNGDDYSLSVSGNNISGGTLQFLLFAGTTPVIRDGYQLICQVVKADGTVLGEDSIAPNSAGNAEFDVSEYLETELSISRKAAWPLFTYPSGGSYIIARDLLSLVYSLKYAEKWGGIIRQLTTTGGYIALQGGLSHHKLDELKAANSNFYKYIKGNKMFLTWCPDEKKTGINTPERLWFINTTGHETIKLKMKAHYRDGTSLTITRATTAALTGQVFEFLVGYKSLTINTKHVNKYDVWLTDGSDAVISEVKTFLIDYKNHLTTNIFLFRNSLGTYDVLRCTGEVVKQPKTGRSTFEDDDENTQALQNLMNYIFSIKTGHINAATATWIDDLLLSKEVYKLENNKALQVLITSKSKTKFSETDRMFNIAFSYQYSHREAYYSKPDAATSGNIIHDSL